MASALRRIARDQGRANEAATSFTTALASAPTEAAPWIALTELYRKWQLPESARTVAEEGVTYVRADEASDVWFVLGMAHDDLRADAQAIAAFTKALEISPTNAKALFQRGQALFRSKKFAAAKRDLEAFVASAAPSQEFAKQHAQRMLMDIGSKSRR